MADLKRTIKCSNCGTEASVYISSDLELKELVFLGKCRCGSSLQVNYSLVPADSSAQQSPSSSSQSGSEALVNIDESLFAPEIPSDAIRDLMEE